MTFLISCSRFLESVHAFSAVFISNGAVLLIYSLFERARLKEEYICTSSDRFSLRCIFTFMLESQGKTFVELAE